LKILFALIREKYFENKITNCLSVIIKKDFLAVMKNILEGINGEFSD
jgi:hypothetical protein